MTQEPSHGLALEFETVLENLSEAVAIVDESGKVLYVNRAGRRMSGPSCKFLYPDGLPVPDEDLPAPRLFSGKAINDYELIIVVRGKERRVSFNGMLASFHGKTAAVLGFRDVTAERGAQELHQDLIWTMSHDLKNPLTVISAQAQLIKGSLQTKGLPKEAAGADAIARTCVCMTKMIEDLVDSIRPGALPKEGRRIKKDLSVLIKELAHRLNTIQPANRIKVSLPEKALEVAIEPYRIEKAIENLVINAFQYSPPYSPVVIRAYKEGTEIITTVSDSGAGIPESEFPNLFQRFYRASNSMGTTGLGLGLFIAQKTIQDHGGSIWVQSKVGHGSTFSFSLPAVEEEIPKQKPEVFS